MAAATPTTSWIERSVEDDNDVLYPTGVWRLPNVPAIAARLRELGLAEGVPVVLDDSRLETLDTAAGCILLKHLADAGCTRAMVSARGFDPRYERLLGLVYERMATPPAAGHTVHLGLLQRVGGAVLAVARMLKSHVDFVGVVTLELASLVGRIMQVLRQVHYEQRLTILMASHDLPMVRNYVQDVIWLHQGRILHGPVAELLTVEKIEEVLEIEMH